MVLLIRARNVVNKVPSGYPNINTRRCWFDKILCFHYQFLISPRHEWGLSIIGVSVPKCQGSGEAIVNLKTCHDVMFHVVMYLDIFSVSVSYLHLHLPFKCTIFLQNIQFFIIVFSQGFCKRECLKHLQFLIICWNSSVLNVHSDHSMFVRNCFYCSIQNLQCWVYLHS